MPYQSPRQRRKFEGCLHNPQHMEGECPDRKTLLEFHNAEYRGKSQHHGNRIKRRLGRGRSL